MTISIPGFDPSDTDPLSPECRKAAELVLQVFLEHATLHGWQAGEAAMAIADAADEFILSLSMSKKTRH